MFPAKILLFGEYSLMHGSDALSVPFRNYGGEWSWSNQNAGSNHMLLNFADYLESNLNEMPFEFNIGKFRSDISLGLYFESTIPISYGLGSSGALCAALYERYITNPISSNCSNNDLLTLRTHLSVLERYFHGTSSGIDPLVSYTNAALIFENSGTIRRLDLSVVNYDQISIFLVDTQTYGSTSHHIQIFKDLLKENYYVQELKNNYNPLVNKCIKSFIDRKIPAFLSHVSSLSKNQQSFFEPMIPSGFLKYFKIAEETSKFAIKLCGSGGGGFLLGFTSDMEYVTTLFSHDDIKLLTVKF